MYIFNHIYIYIHRQIALSTYLILCHSVPLIPHTPTTNHSRYSQGGHWLKLWPSECGPQAPWKLHRPHKGLHSPCAEYMPGIGFSQGVQGGFSRPVFDPWNWPGSVSGWPTQNWCESQKRIVLCNFKHRDTQYNTHAAGNVLGRFCRSSPRLPMSRKMCKSIWIAQTQSLVNHLWKMSVDVERLCYSTNLLLNYIVHCGIMLGCTLFHSFMIAVSR